MRRTLLAGSILLALIAPGVAQDNGRDGNQRFDVASVRPCRPQDNQNEFDKIMALPTPNVGIRYYKPCLVVRQLVLFAYDVPRSRLRGDPAWIRTEWFEVDARAVTPVGIDGMRLLVRQFLADRFGFQGHREVTSGDVYTLVHARTDRRLGPNAKPAVIDCSPFHAGLQDAAGAPRDKNTGRSHCFEHLTIWMQDGVATRHYNGVTMSFFARSLPPLPRGAIVLDETGLDGVFDLTLSTRVADERDAPRIAGNGAAAAVSRALEQQLGLKLEQQKRPVEILVIDRVERPTPN